MLTITNQTSHPEILGLSQQGPEMTKHE